MLLAALATFQYRWLGEVSEAERERMRASLRTRASEFTQEFDAELTRTFLAFQVDRDRLDDDPAAALAPPTPAGGPSTTAPALVRGGVPGGGARVRVGEGAALRSGERGTLEPAAWPPEFAGMVQRTPRLLPQIDGRCRRR